MPLYEPLIVIEGSRQVLDRDGPRGLARWMKAQKRVLFTDTTMRDAHQSLLATRMRSYDITRIAEAYSRGLPELFSLECWGGATFDVAMRFLNEDPWERLAAVRERRAQHPDADAAARQPTASATPTIPTMWCKFFVRQAAAGGVDVFRIFDCLNWVENMRVSIDAVAEADKVAEGAICYTGDLLDPDRAKYDLKYYVGLAKELEAAGAHVLGLKDMAGLLEAGGGDEADRDAEAGGRPADPPPHPRHIGRRRRRPSWRRWRPASTRSMRRWTRSRAPPASRPSARWSRRCADTDRDPGFDAEGRSAKSRSTGRRCGRSIAPSRATSRAARRKSISTKCRAGSSPISRSRRARSASRARWHEVAQTYADVNQMFGDIVKVTPSSKVVGDMALAMVSLGSDPRRCRGSGQGRVVPGFGGRLLCAAISASRRAASRRRCRRRC